MIAIVSVVVLALGAPAVPAVPPPAAQAVAAPAALDGLQCQAPLGQIDLAKGGGGPGGINEQATCTATCTEGPNVSCTASSCSAVNQNCSAGVQGHVVCNGNYTYCASCSGGGGGCTPSQCRAPCQVPGCFASCVDPDTCECETICF